MVVVAFVAWQHYGSCVSDGPSQMLATAIKGVPTARMTHQANEVSRSIVATPLRWSNSRDLDFATTIGKSLQP